MSVESVAAIEQLGEGVLEQRQGVRLPADLRDQFGQQTLLERDPDAPRRSQRGGFELIGGQRRDVEHVARHQAAERRVHQRAVVEVRPQGDQHPGAAPRVRGQGDEAVEEAVALLVVDQREQLFELVDHQQQP